MLDTIPKDERKCAVRDICIDLHTNYKGDELMIRLAQHTSDDWLQMYRYEPFCMSLPDVHQRYMVMSNDNKKMYDKENPGWVDENEEMLKYAKARQKMDLRNTGHKQFLTEMVTWLDKDTPRKDRLIQVLAEYPDATVRVEKSVVKWDD